MQKLKECITSRLALLRGGKEVHKLKENTRQKPGSTQRNEEHGNNSIHKYEDFLVLFKLL